MNSAAGIGFRWRQGVIITGGLVAVAAMGGTLVKRLIDGYVDPWKRRVAEAGFAQKTAKAGDVVFSYAEGPDNGPPLVLLHAQHMDWFSYSRVLPALSHRFHVFDIDYPGHGPPGRRPDTR